MTQVLHVATYNIHKGFSHFNRRLMVHELRDRLQSLGADVVFLQEVQGSHERHASRLANWPQKPQYEFLAGSVWTDFAYGKNAVYDEGHHGNAILSRFPILSWENVDVSAHRFESRGMLHCEIEVPGWDVPLHCVCVHLGLFARGRRKQLAALHERIERLVPADAPLIIAGDFNDWRLQACKMMIEKLGVYEVFEAMRGKTAKSFPAALPLFHLDRIYARGLKVETARVLHGNPWSKISDHAALSASMRLA
jgi:endonuclease/exonuclease/phosphatase family metal-dependent hydrolase